tara:strand:- start:3087 stop:3248 length:162 start_codon:yes stop_codon:yes gene_type:complete
MKGIFLFGSGLMLGIIIGLNLHPKPKKDVFLLSNSINENDTIENYLMKKRYHF